MTRGELLALGVGSTTVEGWIRAGYLFRELPGVYAVGHPGRSEESDLFAAVLYAGPGAALCGLTAALWRGLVKWRTAPAIEVATPRRLLSLPSDHDRNGLRRPIVVCGRRDFPRSPYHGIPTVPIPHIVLGLAATGELQLVRFALAQLDYLRALNLPALEAVCRQGRPGTTLLRQALRSQQPLLARARSPFEVKLVEACELTGIPLPELNVKIANITPDAVWRDEMVVLQCDGEANHGTWRQHTRDAGEDQVLRGLGFYVLRYSGAFQDEVRGIRFLDGNSNQGDALCFEPVGKAPASCG